MLYAIIANYDDCVSFLEGRKMNTNILMYANEVFRAKSYKSVM